MTKKVKGFSPEKNRSFAPAPEVLAHIEVTSDDLVLLLNELSKRKVSPRCYGLFFRMAQMAPARRLAVNLKSVLALMAETQVYCVMPDGLDKDELEALKEVDTSGADMPLRQAAHSLLNVEQRAQLIECIGRTFREQRARAAHYVMRPLDRTGG